MRSLILFLLVTLALSFSGLRAQESSGQVAQYDVVMYEGFPPESYPAEAGKELKPEKPLLTIRVEAGVKFHAEGKGTMFEGRLLSVKDGEAELKIERSRLNSTSCDPIAATVKLNEAISSGGCMFSSIVFSYYFRVKSAGEDDRKRLEETDSPNNGTVGGHANQRSSYHRRFVRAG